MQTENSESENSRGGGATPLKYLVKSVTHSRALKVHLATANTAPRCGGGRGGKSVNGWQEDIGPVNCGRCLQLTKPKNTNV
jgi:hypothetical protein